jgi:hypothetical protein
MNIEQLVEKCTKALPADWRKSPWLHLDHGRAVLDSEDKLNAYISAYGEMHIMKCRKALQNFPFEDIRQNIEIFDWGCGQGIATLTLLDYLSKRDLLGYVSSITLVEPSSVALNRAKQWVQQSAKPHTKIVCLNKYIPSNGNDLWQDARSKTSNAIHLFSNILDVPNVGLNWLANQVLSTARMNYVVCVGPRFNGISRIDDFHRYLGEPECFANFSAYPCGYLSNNNHPYGVEVKCFKVNSDDRVVNDYIEQSNQKPIDEYHIGDECLVGIIPNGLITAFHNLRDICDGKFELFLRPSIGVERPDIVIANISRGIVLINVCDDIAHFGEAFEKVEAIKQALFDIYVKSLKIGSILNHSTFNTIKCGLYFPNNNDEEVSEACKSYYAELKEVNRTAKDTTQFLVKLTSANLEKTINYISAKSFKYDYYQEIIQLIKGHWHSYVDGDLSIRLKSRQREIVKSDKSRIRVKGVAGCGKTQIVAHKAVAEHLRTGKKVLIVTYNISLIQYIKMRINQVPADFSTDAFDIINYHQFFWSKARRYKGNNVQLSASDDLNFFKPYKDAIIKSNDQYETIIIDEAQDYLTEWFDILRIYFLKPNGRFIIFGDGEQNIYGRVLEQDSKMPTVHDFNGRWLEMSERISMRLLNPNIAKLASDFSRRFNLANSGELQAQSELNLYDYKIRYWNISESTSPERIQSYIRWIIENHEVNGQKIMPKDVVVLGISIALLRAIEAAYVRCTNLKTMTTFESQDEFLDVSKSNLGNAALDLKAIRRVAKVHFTTDCNELKFSTIYSFKGWESKTIILLLQNEVEDDQKFNDESYGMHSHETTPALVYTAITRPKENLFILNLGNKKYHDFFKGKIENE